MKKLSTLFTLLLVALFGLQANASIYMIGNGKALGNWNPANGLELTQVGTSNRYMAQDVNIFNNGNDFYFIFADVNTSWEEINGQAPDEELGTEGIPSQRYSPLEANEQVAFPEGESAITVTTQHSYNGDASYYAPDGKYTILFDLSNPEEPKFRLTRTGDAEDDSDPIVVTGSVDIFIKSADPENVFVYCWNMEEDGGSAPGFGAWPGTKLTEIEGVTTIEKDGETFYKAVAPFSEIGIVLNNGAGTQTADIKPVTGGIALEYPLDGDFTQYAEVDLPEEAPDVYVMGQVNGNGWDTNVGVKMENTEGKIYVLKNCEINGYFGFTLQLSEASGAWDEIAPYRFAALNADERVLDAEDIDVPQDLTEPGNNPVDNSFSLPSGTYTLTVNLGNRTLIVSGEVIEEPYEPTGEMYILGEMNGNSWGSDVGVKMETADQKVFTATVLASGTNLDEVEEIEYSYFSFTEKLDADWSNIGSYRYGAPEDGMIPVIGEENPVGARKSTNAFKLESGKEYKLTFDRENLTLLVELAGGGEFAKGDVNGDGAVGAADIGCLVNVLAGLENEAKYEGRADVTGDGAVSATDIAAIVNILAGLE